MGWKRSALFAGCLGFFLSALPLFAEDGPRQTSLPLPPDTRLVWMATATGFQVYKALPSGEPQASLRWVFQEPEATLRDPSGAKIGRHFRGPCWEATDGSRVMGSMPPLAQSPAGNPSDVPWLLITVQSSGTAGVLSGVTHVLRVGTQGGVAPAAKPSKAGELVRVPYKATYLFLAPSAGSSPSPH
ncbi:hypothetical protein MAMC_01339 [Methylacidimicrobium cyclopophantes]|uniref:DUF3455 domain-containing protein n=1 Tax=Methylacidimicrobium cyclopophantes TaxID=1041766 RepID=A0A5E6MBV6_9BACT|nr:DUF3455 domain-containing protein [Methylacidimicrobium cyclopophantes]VVM06915.1 hypothetical protein MAMC_01339 [Methylacidimicrobium cyclopophantes]